MSRGAVNTTNLRAGPAPHWRLGPRRHHLNGALLVGLIPACAAAVAVQGFDALGRLAVAAGAAVVVELLTARAFRQPVRVGDFSALVEGLVLAMLLPPTVPYWLLLIGVVVMVVVGKQVFGGTGGYPIHPALIGWAVLLLSWPHRVHPVGDMLIGTAWLPALWIGGVLLVFTGHIRWQAPLGMLLGVALAVSLLPGTGIGGEGLVTQLGTGSLVLATFFVVTDSPCGPANSWARLVYGVAAGVLVILLRRYGVWPEPVPFALILASLISPLLDRGLKGRPLGRIATHA